MRKRLYIPIFIMIPVLTAAFLIYLKTAQFHVPDVTLSRLPQIDPDYNGIVIPPNIAPLNFVIHETAEKYEVILSSPSGKSLRIRSRRREIRIPVNKWRPMLQDTGSALTLQIQVRQGGQWVGFHPVQWSVSPEPIDTYLIYRCSAQSKVPGVYARNLSGFEIIPAQRQSPDSLLFDPAGPVSDRNEFYPEWSPDGVYLYFCSAPAVTGADTDHAALYDLNCIRYDRETGAWGSLQTVLSAENLGKSISAPHISPDGRFLMFCASDTGTHSQAQPDTDLMMMSLQTGMLMEVLLNSSLPEQDCAWSANSRWIVFGRAPSASAGLSGYIAHVDKTGRISKPFPLPLKYPGQPDRPDTTMHSMQLSSQTVYADIQFFKKGDRKYVNAPR